MPLTISQLTGQADRPVKLQFLGEDVNLVYRPSVYTPELEEMSVFDALLKLLVSWDVLDAEGQPYPIDEKSLRILPTPFLQRVFQRITQDVRVSGDPTPSATTSAG